MSALKHSESRRLTRRDAVRAVAGFLAGSPLLRSQQDPLRDHSRVPSLDELVTAFDFEAVAYAKLPRATFNYMARGSAGEFTLRRNREAFDWVDIVPKAVVDVGSIDTTTEILNTKMAFPIMVAPTSGHAALHPDAEAGMRLGCTAAAETPMIVSHAASLPMEKIGSAGSAPLWFQLYARQNIEDNRAPLEAARTAGARAVVVTVDQQAAYYERVIHDRHLSYQPARRQRRRSAPPNPYRVPTSRLWYDWKLFDELRSLTDLPLLAKGILTAEDARRCVDRGLEGIVVSNHGGRTLDCVPSSLEVLPEIIDAVGGRIPVLVDSGFRRGSDILKALALGASAVCLGRVSRWGLAAFGAPGVERVLKILQGELVLAMAHTGRPSVASIDRSLARTDFP